uniref:Uncharacterized protein n=1 Tax=viral metagenome TaxID=1070528 RepID=A0A6C0EBS4_9ZZZZ
MAYTKELSERISKLLVERIALNNRMEQNDKDFTKCWYVTTEDSHIVITNDIDSIFLDKTKINLESCQNYVKGINKICGILYSDKNHLYTFENYDYDNECYAIITKDTKDDVVVDEEEYIIDKNNMLEILKELEKLFSINRVL